MATQILELPVISAGYVGLFLLPMISLDSYYTPGVIIVLLGVANRAVVTYSFP